MTRHVLANAKRACGAAGSQAPIRLAVTGYTERYLYYYDTLHAGRVISIKVHLSRVT